LSRSDDERPSFISVDKIVTDMAAPLDMVAELRKLMR
jgi:hypothetical protein